MALILFLLGCTDNASARQFGGSTTVELDCDKQFVNMTWKENSLWLLTKQPNPDWIPTVYFFDEKSAFGFTEGHVAVKEKACR